jgi:hypothetical protein
MLLGDGRWRGLHPVEVRPQSLAKRKQGKEREQVSKALLLKVLNE